MNYLSCFSGIGGLEASDPPVLLCESDAAVSAVLRSLYPNTPLWPDVQTLEPPAVDVVAGGWPCQDLSVAGRQSGLTGLRSRLLLDMLRVARSARAHTVVAENVPNLLQMRSGEEFAGSLAAFHEHGFRFVSWRLLNAREFGLPQSRSRLLLIASNDRDVALTIFRELPTLSPEVTAAEMRDLAAGFYWTAGTHSINYSRGYVPTIKVGSSVGIPSPPAVHYDNVVRTLSAKEALILQGFDIDPSMFRSSAAAYAAAGNAVARPIGKWVLDGLALAGDVRDPTWIPAQTELWADRWSGRPYPRAGLSTAGSIAGVEHRPTARATDLYSWLDRRSRDRLSPRAARGLLTRLARSGQACPPALRAALAGLAADGARA